MISHNLTLYKEGLSCTLNFHVHSSSLLHVAHSSNVKSGLSLLLTIVSIQTSLLQFLPESVVKYRDVRTVVGDLLAIMKQKEAQEAEMTDTVRTLIDAVINDSCSYVSQRESQLCFSESVLATYFQMYCLSLWKSWIHHCSEPRLFEFRVELLPSTERCLLSRLSSLKHST